MVDCYIVDFISSSTTKLILKSDAVVIYLNPGHPKLSSIAYNLLKNDVTYLTFMKITLIVLI